MSEKTYTPYEVARKALEKCQELYNMSKAEKPKAMDKCGEMSKEESDTQKTQQPEMDKCGEMSKEEKELNPKLKSFLDKRKEKKTKKMEKMMGIGEKAKTAAPAPAAAPAVPPMAQTKAPVNAPKPPVAGMKKPGM